MMQLSLNPTPAILFALTISFVTIVSPDSIADSTDAAQHWTSDNGNGTYSNPLFYEEFEDPDVIRVGNDYFLAGTTMCIHAKAQTDITSARLMRL